MCMMLEGAKRKPSTIKACSFLLLLFSVFKSRFSPCSKPRQTADTSSCLNRLLRCSSILETHVLIQLKLQKSNSHLKKKSLKKSNWWLIKNNATSKACATNRFPVKRFHLFYRSVKTFIFFSTGQNISSQPRLRQNERHGLVCPFKDDARHVSHMYPWISLFIQRYPCVQK